MARLSAFILAFGLCLPLAHARGSVRKVDLSEAPEMQELAVRARHFGNKVYPRILALLDSSRSPRRFDIVFKKDLAGNVGQTKGTTINLLADWFVTRPAHLEAVLTHEMTHVSQQCGTNAPVYWVEGVADYVCFKFGYTNDSSLPECSIIYSHYTSGYCCAGAFLLYLDNMYGSNVIRQLNTSLRRGKYTDQLFTRATGKRLDQLWTDFQKTPAFSPAAAEVNKISEELGYVNGQPPTDLPLRMRTYVTQQPGGSITLDAAQFLRNLVERNQLPGISSNKPQSTSRGKSFTLHIDWLALKESSSAAYPASRSFCGRKTDDSSTWHYTVVRQSAHAAWELQKAWRTDSAGKLLQEFSLP